MGKQNLDALLAQLERTVDDPDLIDNLRDAIDEQAENPNLVRDLRKQRDTAISERDSLRLERQVDVLKDAGVPESAHKRFLRDWHEEKVEADFNVDNVKAKASEFGYRLEASNGDGGDSANPPANGGTDAEQLRREAQQRRQDGRAGATHDDALPPDLDAQIAAAEKAGDRELSFALKHQKMQQANA